ncbi:MAG: serine/threonine-protein kinase [Caldilineaceae bacterium]
MAEVYKAFQPGVERFVAIKVLHCHLAKTKDSVERFLREARAIGRLHHTNIVHIIDIEATDTSTTDAAHHGSDHNRAANNSAVSDSADNNKQEQCYYMVMDYIDGETLGHYLQSRKRLEVAEALQIAQQLAMALAYAHDQGMVHRDIKPTNILLRNRNPNEVILTDFGLARLFDDMVTGLTVSGALVGTPTYMSPEAVRGEPCDARTDVYSLGVVLYELVTGKPPYVANTPYSMMMKLANDPLPPPRELNPMLPDAVEALLLKALAKEADVRYQSATAFAEALAQVLAEVAPVPSADKVQRHATTAQVAHPKLATHPLRLQRPQSDPSEVRQMPTSQRLAPEHQAPRPAAPSTVNRWWGLMLAVAGTAAVSLITIEVLLGI